MAALWREKLWRRLDWPLLGALGPLVIAGLVTMDSFAGDRYFFDRQLVWFAVALIVLLLASLIDWQFLRRSGVLVALYFLGAALLVILLLAGSAIKGAQSWFNWGGVSFQPADFMKLILILILAKYFSRRHVEIAHLRHILISGLYALLPFGLIFFQPDFGSAVVIFLIWLGLAAFSGISRKHLFGVLGAGLLAFVILWFFVFQPYQQARILTFLHPLNDIRGAGYNSFQSTIAVGAGQILGKGVGLGTQSRLRFLPEYQTDFIFAAFAEEWGLVGVSLFFILFGLVIWRIIRQALLSETNFEALFAIGLAVWFLSHFTIHVGMNIGLLPVTGLTLPFASYGGSHLVAQFFGLGILMGMRRWSRGFHRDDIKNEFVGLT